MPTSINYTLAAAHVLLNLYQLFVLPLYLLPSSPWWALTLLPVAALSNSFWSLIHESIHDLFHPSTRVNVFFGRLLSVFFGSSFRVLRISHLMHHKLNRSPVEGTELYDPSKTSRGRAALGYYFQILGGLYLLEVASSFLFLLPRTFLELLEGRFFPRDSLSKMWLKSLLNARSIREIRIDGTAILVLYFLSSLSYGENVGLLLGTIVIRAFLISFLDNIYHYQTPVDDVSYAHNLWLPHWLSLALLHFNFHGIHHRNPALPWIRLPEVFRDEAPFHNGNFFLAAMFQFSGPIPIAELRVYPAELSPGPLADR